MFITVHTGEAIAVFTSLSAGPIPVVAAWPICRIDTIIRGVIIRLDTTSIMVCRIIIRVITESISMSALADIGPVGIGIAGTTGMAVILITGTAQMSLLSRIRM